MGAQWKHKGKQANASARGAAYSKLAKAIIMAAKGGADVATNAKLRIAVDAAKKASMPRDTIERSIKKGAGLLDESVSYDIVTFEGFGPHRVPVIVECLTDNKNRTTPNMRFHFKGQLGATGSVSWDFAHLGMIDASPPRRRRRRVAAIEAGAQDLEAGDDGATRFFTEPADLDAVHQGAHRRRLDRHSAVIGWKAKNPVTVDDPARAEVEAWLEALDADDDVQRLYVALA
jgi:YebC/PmpR family DNA-binding regulatory protein